MAPFPVIVIAALCAGAVMLYGVFSDVHSNLEALEAVLAFFEKAGVDAYLCVGDLVGYGADPDACVRTINSLKNVTVVAGNHDLAAVGLKELGWFNEYAQGALEINKKLLSLPSKRYLRSLPTMFSDAHFTLVHGSPRNAVDEYLISLGQFRENLYYLDTPICFIGHTHIPTVFVSDADHYFYSFIPIEGEHIKLRPEYRVVVNVGSVGQPRDYDCRAVCVLFDTQKNELIFKRVEYDVEKAQRKMRKLHLPSFLIERIAAGR